MKRFFITILFLGICGATFAKGTLKYQVLKPAEHPLPKDVKTIAFVFRNIKFEADSITKHYKFNGEIFSDTTNYSKAIAEAAYLGFCSAVEEQYPLDSVPMFTLPQTIGNADRNIVPLAWNKVNELCKQHNSDILVSLNDISIFNNYETWYDGDEYNGVADISSFHSWTIYDPLTEQHIFQETDLDSLQSHETSYSYDNLIKSKLPHREEIMKIIAFSIGENLGKKIVPHWKTIYREYYDSGSKEMRTAANMVKSERWEDALKIWKEITEEGKTKNKARAAFNSAVIYERLGKISEALVAIQQSINIYKTSTWYEDELGVAEILKKILEERQKEIVKLQAQQEE